MSCTYHVGHRDKDGYGRVYSPETKGQVPAHRAAFCEHRGMSLGSIAGQVVRHTCDNPGCINPLHLVLGSQQDNINDKMERDRCAKGEANGASSLSDVQVEEIRRRYTGKRGELTALGKEFGTSRVTIKNIVSGRYRCRTSSST